MKSISTYYFEIKGRDEDNYKAIILIFAVSIMFPLTAFFVFTYLVFDHSEWIANHITIYLKGETKEGICGSDDTDNKDEGSDDTDNKDEEATLMGVAAQQPQPTDTLAITPSSNQTENTATTHDKTQGAPNKKVRETSFIIEPQPTDTLTTTDDPEASSQQTDNQVLTSSYYLVTSDDEIIGEATNNSGEATNETILDLEHFQIETEDERLCQQEKIKKQKTSYKIRRSKVTEKETDVVPQSQSTNTSATLDASSHQAENIAPTHDINSGEETNNSGEATNKTILDFQIETENQSLCGQGKKKKIDYEIRKINILALSVTFILLANALLVFHIVASVKLIDYGNKVLFDENDVQSYEEGFKYNLLHDDQCVPIVYTAFSFLPALILICSVTILYIKLAKNKKSYDNNVTLGVFFEISFGWFFVYLAFYFLPFMILALINHPIQAGFIYLTGISFAFSIFISIKAICLITMKLMRKLPTFNKRKLLFVPASAILIAYFLIIFIFILTIGSFRDFQAVQNLTLLINSLLFLFVIKPFVKHVKSKVEEYKLLDKKQKQKTSHAR